MIETFLKPHLRWSLPLCLALLALLAFSNSFPASYIGDDIAIVKNNPLVANIDVKQIFTTDYWGPEVDSGLYRPVTILSFALNRLMFGDSASAVHAVNLLLHLLVTLLLFRVLQQFAVPLKVAWLAAALFAVHPIHTEVVNLAVGRAELLAALGFWGTLWAWNLKRTALAWPLMCFTFLVGLLSKENAIVLLGVLPGLELFRGAFRQGRWRAWIWPYAMLVGTAGGWLVWRTWWVVRQVPTDGYDPVYTPLAYLSLEQRILTALKLQGLYLKKLLFPWDLQGIYSGTSFFQPVDSLLSLEGLVVLAASLLLLAGGTWLFWQKKLLGLGFLLYLVAFTPTANLFFVTGATFAERLAYLPSLGFCLALAALLVRLSAKLRVRGQTALGFVVLSAFLLVSLARNPDYGSPLLLWQKDVQRDPQNLLALMYLAKTQSESGLFAEANKSYQALVNRAPDFYAGLQNYAAFLLQQGEFEAAINTARLVAAQGEGRSPTNDLVLAQAYVETGDFIQALKQLNQLPEIYKNYGIYWEFRGRALEGLGDVAGAIESYGRMESYPPGSTVPLRLGRLLLQRGELNAAREVLTLAVERNPVSAAVWNSLGVVHAMSNEMTLARAAFERANQLEPDNANYQQNLKRATAR